MNASAYLSLVKFEHTIFALPFAYAGMLLAVDAAGTSLTPSLVVWITVAMVGARTLAMAINRLVDAEIDARNPRTANREIPSGTLSRRAVTGLSAAALALLLLAVSQLHPVTWWLWPVPVALFVLYPYTKRFTWACHLVLGTSIGLAAPGAWLAVTGALELTPVLLGIAIATWVAGFDVIYATQDLDVDRREGLRSIPARFGVARALLATQLLHVVTVAALVAAGVIAGLGAGYWAGMVIVAGLLAYENAIVKPGDLSRVDAAFFTTNGIIAIVFVTAVALGLALPF